MLSNEELLVIRGGAITSTMFNSISRLIETLFKIGRSVGSSIRRAYGKKTCKLS